MNLKKLEQFLYMARAKTYASNGKKIKALLTGSNQLEYIDGGYLYRDLYYTGKNNFTGLETIYYKEKPVFSMCYYGNWGEMTETEIDNILRGALIANPETRSYKNIKWGKDGFIYNCTPDTDIFNEISGGESITKKDDQMYYLYYAGGLLI